MTRQDIATFILSEATGLELLDALRITSGIAKVLVGLPPLHQVISCDQALETLARWQCQKL